MTPGQVGSCNQELRGLQRARRIGVPQALRLRLQDAQERVRVGPSQGRLQRQSRGAFQKQEVGDTTAGPAVRSTRC